MNISSLPLARVIGAASLLLVGLVALPQEARADRSRHSSYHGSSSQKHDSHRKSSRHRGGNRHRSFSSYRPRSGFGISFGTGSYYGRSYSPYSYGRTYYSQPSYRTYENRTLSPARGQNATVQRALSRRGYYRGSIDGIIGSQSRRAILNYQQDRRLRPTGTITSELLRSLGV